MKNISCLRCNTEMEYVARESIQLGQAGLVLGTLPNLIAGALEVDIYACPSCRRLELFATDAESDEDELPKRTCPNCKNVHDFDYPKCPKCGRNYY